MTFATEEESVEGSRPVDLYEFTVGDVAYRYSSSERVVLAGQAYERRAIFRDKIVYGQVGSGVIAVTLPADDEFAVQYANTTPSKVSRCSITRYQRDSGESIVIYRGVVASIDFIQDGRAARVALQSEESSGNRSFPRFTYQQMCNHFLGDSGCGVDLTPFRWEGVVEAIEGNLLVVTGAGSQPLRLKNGTLRPSGIDDVRTVIDQEGDELRILYPFAALAVGATVVATAGCDHLMNGDCAHVFDNVRRFGGFAWVPLRNPFTKGLA